MPCQQYMLQGMPSSVDVIADSDSDVAEVVDIVDSNLAFSYWTDLLDVFFLGNVDLPSFFCIFTLWIQVMVVMK